jgi:translation elongation factor EF-Tu-like GTPase
MTGYGARTLLTPTGAVALNNNDTVIAGTNLFKGNDVTSYPEGALNLGGNNSKIENLLEKLIGVSSNQQFGIDLDGRSVGTGIVRATYRSA